MLLNLFIYCPCVDKWTLLGVFITRLEQSHRYKMVTDVKRIADNNLLRLCILLFHVYISSIICKTADTNNNIPLYVLHEFLYKYHIFHVWKRIFNDLWRLSTRLKKPMHIQTPTYMLQHTYDFRDQTISELIRTTRNLSNILTSSNGRPRMKKMKAAFKM